MGARRDLQDRSNWKWLSGKDVTVSFWNLPGGNENCARYDGTKGWLWADTNCNRRLHFICQHRQSIVLSSFSIKLMMFSLTSSLGLYLGD